MMPWLQPQDHLSIYFPLEACGRCVSVSKSKCVCVYPGPVLLIFTVEIINATEVFWLFLDSTWVYMRYECDTIICFIVLNVNYFILANFTFRLIVTPFYSPQTGPLPTAHVCCSIVGVDHFCVFIKNITTLKTKCFSHVGILQNSCSMPFFFTMPIFFLMSTFYHIFAWQLWCG